MTETPEADNQKPADEKKSSGKQWWIIGCAVLFLIGLLIGFLLLIGGIFSVAVVSQRQSNEMAIKMRMNEEATQRKMIEEAKRKLERPIDN